MAGSSANTTSGPIRLALAGAARLVDSQDARGRALPSRDAALLAFLALQGPTSRSHLIGMLWPDADAESARNALRQRIFQLNRRAGRDLVAGSELLSLAEGVAVDAAAGAELLQGGEFSQWPRFDEWLSQRRAAHARAGRDALVSDVDAAQRDGRIAEALQLAERLLALDPLHEEAHRRLMRLHYLNGDRAAAITAFEHCEQLLKDELGVKPGAETQALLHTVERATAAAPARRVLPLAVQRPPRLIGRGSELTAMRLAAASGRGVWLIGEAGMGKSRLLAEWAGERRSALVVQARHDDITTPYGTLSRLLRTLLQLAPQALDGQAQAGIEGLLPELGSEPSAATLSPRQLRAATDRLVCAAAATGIDTLIVDDLQFADEASITVMNGAIGPASPLAFAYAARPGEGCDAAAALLRLLVDARAVDVVTLSPLDEAGLHQLIESLALPELDADALAPLIARHSSGNPMFALETLKQLVLEGPTAAGLPRPAHVGQLIEKRLRRLSPRALSLARIAAVAGTDFSVGLAEQLLGAGVLELADAWQELETAQVFRCGSFAHDLVHEAALRLVPQPLAQTLHGRIAGHLQMQRAAVERIAHHWQSSLDAERAVPALRAAAQAALSLFQRPPALAHLVRAVDFLLQLQRDREAFDVQLEVVTLLQGHDSGERHEAAVAKLQQIAATPEETVRTCIAWAILRHIQGRDTEAVAAIDGCAAQAAAAGPRERSESANVRGVALRKLGRIDEAIAAHREALAIARAADAREELPGCLNNLALALLEANDAPQAALAFDESARLQPDVMTRARVLNNLGIAREEIGQLDTAFELRRDALGLLRGQEGAEFARANILISMAANARALQRYRQALALLGDAAAIGLPPTHWRTCSLHVQRAALWIELGAFDRADAEVALASQSAASASAQAEVLILQAGYRQARGAAAGDLLDRCDALLRERGDRRTIRLARYRRALEGDPAERRALAARELDIESSHGNRAAQVAFGAALVQALLDLGDAPAALAAARCAVQTMHTADPLCVTPLQVRHLWWQALRAAGDAAADALIFELEAQLLAIAERDVPSDCKHLFLRGVRLNRQLLGDADAARRCVARVNGNGA